MISTSKPQQFIACQILYFVTSWQEWSSPCLYSCGVRNSGLGIVYVLINLNFSTEWAGIVIYGPSVIRKSEYEILKTRQTMKKNEAFFFHLMFSCWWLMKWVALISWTKNTFCGKWQRIKCTCKQAWESKSRARLCTDSDMKITIDCTKKCNENIQKGYRSV